MRTTISRVVKRAKRTSSTGGGGGGGGGQQLHRVENIPAGSFVSCCLSGSMSLIRAHSRRVTRDARDHRVELRGIPRDLLVLHVCFAILYHHQCGLVHQKVLLVPTEARLIG